MIHRIMLAAALLAVPAIVVAGQPVVAHAQQADSSKTKAKSGKKGMHKKGGKRAAPKAAPKDGGTAK
jgi:hypothetical protein